MLDALTEQSPRETPPPCGEGKGWGSQSRNDRLNTWPDRRCQPALSLRGHQAAPPPPLPTRGEGFPAPVIASAAKQ
jgi:hypothetical protein